MMQEKSFSIQLLFPNDNEEKILPVQHPDETFEFEWNRQTIFIINNGDNSWGKVKGNTDQQIIDFIGEAIENHYRNKLIF
jgi:hypothetical protein